jgi:hypothetical protein
MFFSVARLVVIVVSSIFAGVVGTNVLVDNSAISQLSKAQIKICAN